MQYGSCFCSSAGPGSATCPHLGSVLEKGWDRGKKEVPFLNGGGLESPLWRLECGKMGSGEESHFQFPMPGFLSDLFFCTIMTFFWGRRYLRHKYWSIDSSGAAQIIMIVTSPLSNKIYFSDCRAPGWPLVGLWFRPSIQHIGRERLVVSGQFSSNSSYLSLPCLQPDQTHPESDYSTYL